MLPCCPRTHGGGGGGGGGGGYRGPPPPLILAPLIYQLVRRSCDPKMVAYVRDLVAHQGPHAVAVNAHKIVQYALSKVPADVLYWFAAKVLNLAPDAAMQTTAFLKSRTDIECDDPPPPPPLQLAGNSTRPAPAELVVGGTVSSSSMAEIERRLERLEIDYQALQEKHYESMKLWTRTPENIHLPRELPMPDSAELRPEAATWLEEESKQLVKVDSQQSFVSDSSSSEVDGQALLQDVGLRLGRVFIEWAGDTIKQNLVTAAAARISADQPLAGAGIDLAGRLVDAIIV